MRLHAVTQRNCYMLQESHIQSNASPRLFQPRSGRDLEDFQTGCQGKICDSGVRGSCLGIDWSYVCLVCLSSYVPLLILQVTEAHQRQQHPARGNKIVLTKQQSPIPVIVHFTGGMFCFQLMQLGATWQAPEEVLKELEIMRSDPYFFLRRSFH